MLPLPPFMSPTINSARILEFSSEHRMNRARGARSAISLGNKKAGLWPAFYENKLLIYMIFYK